VPGNGRQTQALGRNPIDFESPRLRRWRTRLIGRRSGIPGIVRSCASFRRLDDRTRKASSGSRRSRQRPGGVESEPPQNVQGRNINRPAPLERLVPVVRPQRGGITRVLVKLLADRFPTVPGSGFVNVHIVRRDRGTLRHRGRGSFRTSRVRSPGSSGERLGGGLCPRSCRRVCGKIRRRRCQSRCWCRWRCQSRCWWDDRSCYRGRCWPGSGRLGRLGYSQAAAAIRRRKLSRSGMGCTRRRGWGQAGRRRNAGIRGSHGHGWHRKVDRRWNRARSGRGRSRSG